MKRQLQLGPRTRRVVRSLARRINPVVVLIAGRRWMPILGLLYHRGRRSGRLYRTPLGMRRHGDAIIMPRTFGEEAAWYRNIVAAGGACARYLGRDYTVAEPRVLDYATAQSAFPRYERLQFRLLGINQFLSLRITTAESIDQPVAYLKEA